MSGSVSSASASPVLDTGSIFSSSVTESCQICFHLVCLVFLSNFTSNCSSLVSLFFIVTSSAAASEDRRRGTEERGKGRRR